MLTVETPVPPTRDDVRWTQLSPMRWQAVDGWDDVVASVENDGVAFSALDGEGHRLGRFADLGSAMHEAEHAAAGDPSPSGLKALLTRRVPVGISAACVIAAAIGGSVTAWLIGTGAA